MTSAGGGPTVAWMCWAAVAFASGETSLGSGCHTGGRSWGEVDAVVVAAGGLAAGVVPGSVGVSPTSGVEDPGVVTPLLCDGVGWPTQAAVAVTAPRARTCRRVQPCVTLPMLRLPHGNH